MRWLNFLHIYQPAEQQPDILESVVVQSYRPLLEGMKAHPRARITLNVNGSLLELFDQYRYRDLIDIMRDLLKQGRLEITGCAKYHALLPFLDAKEITRQIQANQETGKFFLGDVFKPQGFFPPEMAYNEQLAPILSELGFRWVILDEIAFSGKSGGVDYEQMYKIRDTGLGVFFRERRASNLIMSAVVRSGESLGQALAGRLKEEPHSYLVTGMDGETFGHHRPGLEKLLFETFDMPEFEPVTGSELLDGFKGQLTEVEPVRSTWASSEQDIERGVPFLSWQDPENEIHGWQWALVNLALTEVRGMDEKDRLFPELRAKMDRALASDHFWWASAKPWWSLEMIESGAWRLLDVIRSVPNVQHEVIDQARRYYENIVSTAFQWKRSGKIFSMMQERQNILRIPFKERTLEKGGNQEGVYNAFVDMLKNLEKEAAARGEYEKAILWRDAIYKLEHKTDIYDAIHAIELLRLHIPHEEVEKTLDKYTAKYYKLRGGQPEQRGA